jgi:hypothetical protein
MTEAAWKYQFVCHRCGRTKPIDAYMTNAEYIRSMTNDEMADWLVHKIKCTGCNAERCDEEFCVNLMKEWLEYPHEDL